MTWWSLFIQTLYSCYTTSWDSTRQLAGARRQLFDLRTPIKLKNPRRSEEILDPRSIQEIYLVSVLMGEGESLFSFAEFIKTYTAHVFTRDFTQDVLTELDTISDFTMYLRAKESIIRQGKSIMILGGEEELLAFYLLNDRSFAKFEEAWSVMIDEGSWQHLQDHPQYLARKREDQISYFWDDMINTAHKGFVEYERIAREFARATRFHRRFLSKSFIDAQITANSDESAGVRRRFMSFEGVTYCFLYCDEKMPNEDRESLLEMTCFVARGKFQQNAKVYVVKTSGTKGEPLKRATWTLTGSGSSQICQPPFG